MRKLVPWVVALVGLGGPALADDSDTSLWRSVGSWQVRVDPTLGHGCFMMGSYQNGEALRIGFDNRNQSTGYMMLGSSKWRSLEAGKKYTITVQFNGAAAVDWTGTSINVAGKANFLWLPFTNSNVWKVLAERTDMAITYQGKSVTDLPLSGTVEAIKTVFECNAQFIASNGDPFASTVSDDPFIAK